MGHVTNYGNVHHQQYRNYDHSSGTDELHPSCARGCESENGNESSSINNINNVGSSRNINKIGSGTIVEHKQIAGTSYDCPISIASSNEVSTTNNASRSSCSKSTHQTFFLDSTKNLDVRFCTDTKSNIDNGTQSTYTGSCPGSGTNAIKAQKSDGATVGHPYLPSSSLCWIVSLGTDDAAFSYKHNCHFQRQQQQRSECSCDDRDHEQFSTTRKITTTTHPDCEPSVTSIPSSSLSCSSLLAESASFPSSSPPSFQIEENSNNSKNRDDSIIKPYIDERIRGKNDDRHKPSDYEHDLDDVGDDVRLVAQAAEEVRSIMMKAQRLAKNTKNICRRSNHHNALSKPVERSTNATAINTTNEIGSATNTVPRRRGEEDENEHQDGVLNPNDGEDLSNELTLPQLLQIVEVAHNNKQNHDCSPDRFLLEKESNMWYTNKTENTCLHLMPSNANKAGKSTAGAVPAGITSDQWTSEDEGEDDTKEDSSKRNVHHCCNLDDSNICSYEHDSDHSPIRTRSRHGIHSRTKLFEMMQDLLITNSNERDCERDSNSSDIGKNKSSKMSLVPNNNSNNLKNKNKNVYQSNSSCRQRYHCKHRSSLISLSTSNNLSNKGEGGRRNDTNTCNEVNVKVHREKNKSIQNEPTHKNENHRTEEHHRQREVKIFQTTEEGEIAKAVSIVEIPSPFLFKVCPNHNSSNKNKNKTKTSVTGSSYATTMNNSDETSSIGHNDTTPILVGLIRRRKFKLALQRVRYYPTEATMEVKTHILPKCCCKDKNIPHTTAIATNNGSSYHVSCSLALHEMIREIGRTRMPTTTMGQMSTNSNLVSGPTDLKYNQYRIIGEGQQWTSPSLFSRQNLQQSTAVLSQEREHDFVEDEEISTQLELVKALIDANPDALKTCISSCGCTMDRTRKENRNVTDHTEYGYLPLHMACASLCEIQNYRTQSVTGGAGDRIFQLQRQQQQHRILELQLGVIRILLDRHLSGAFHNENATKELPLHIIVRWILRNCIYDNSTTNNNPNTCSNNICERNETETTPTPTEIKTKSTDHGHPRSDHGCDYPNGFYVNEKEEQYDSGFHRSDYCCQAECIATFLVMANPNGVNVQDYTGETPLGIVQNHLRAIDTNTGTQYTTSDLKEPHDSLSSVGTRFRYIHDEGNDRWIKRPPSTCSHYLMPKFRSTVSAEDSYRLVERLETLLCFASQMTTTRKQTLIANRVTKASNDCKNGNENYHTAAVPTKEETKKSTPMSSRMATVGSMCASTSMGQLRYKNREDEDDDFYSDRPQVTEEKSNDTKSLNYNDSQNMPPVVTLFSNHQQLDPSSLVIEETTRRRMAKRKTRQSKEKQKIEMVVSHVQEKARVLGDAEDLLNKLLV